MTDFKTTGNECEKCGCAYTDKHSDGYTERCYRVFPGIALTFTDAHVGQAQIGDTSGDDDRVIEIIHCREGRAEFNINGEFVFLSPGDLMIAKRASLSSGITFPIRHFHGLSVQIELDLTPHCLSCFLDDVNVEPEMLADKLCLGNTAYIARASASAEHIFSEIYSVPERIRCGYYKLKVLELLLFLSELDVKNDESDARVCSSSFVALAERIGAYLGDHVDERITIDHLADKFHVSSAQVKKLFKSVYGVPVGAYIRTLKMESAAYMLEYTDKTILDIAGEHGYDNGSKFAAAFRSVKGLNPAEYRIAQKRKSK